MRVFYCLFLSFFLFYCQLDAQLDAQAIRFNLDSRYFTESYSNQAVGQFGIDFIQLTRLPADWIVSTDSTRISNPGRFLFYDKQEARNLGNGLILFANSIIFSTAYTFAYHEFGHGTRTAALGYEPFYGHGSINTQQDLLDAFSGRTKTYDNFLSYFFASIFNTGGYALSSNERTRFPVLFDEFTNNGWDGVVAMGGLNNEMLFTGNIEDQMNRQGAHIGYLIPYINGKLSAANYSEGAGIFNDANNIVNFYQGKGYDVSFEDIDRASRLSFFGSSISYQLIYQFIQMFRGQSPHFSAWSIGNFELPNTQFYLTRSGLSYKFTTAYQKNNWRFPIGWERIFNGDQRSELSIGAESYFEKWNAQGLITLGEVFEISIQGAYQLTPYLELAIGYNLFDQRNLHGERLIPSLENGSNFHDLFIKAIFVIERSCLKTPQ